LKVAKQLPSTQAEKADKFNEMVKGVIDGVEGVSITVNSVLGAGYMYRTIEVVTTHDED
jgi:hypothetical protein